MRHQSIRRHVTSRHVTEEGLALLFELYDVLRVLLRVVISHEDGLVRVGGRVVQDVPG